MAPQERKYGTQANELSKAWGEGSGEVRQLTSTQTRGRERGQTDRSERDGEGKREGERRAVRKGERRIVIGRRVTQNGVILARRGYRDTRVVAVFYPFIFNHVCSFANRPRNEKLDCY